MRAIRISAKSRSNVRLKFRRRWLTQATKRRQRTYRLLVVVMRAMKNIVPAAKPIIAMYGDSTTAGWTDSGGITSNNEPALLQAALPGVIVENHGISGIT